MLVKHGHISKQSGEKTYYYSCNLKTTSKNIRCQNKNANAIELDFAIKQALKELGQIKNDLLTKLDSKQNNPGSALSHSLTSKNKNDLKTASAKADILTRLISEKRNQIDKLLTKLSLDDELTDLFISKIKDLKKEIYDLEEKLKSISINRQEAENQTLNLSFIKTLLNKCSLIDTLHNDEIKIIINYLVESITWNGETNDFVISFLGEDSSRKEAENFPHSD